MRSGNIADGDRSDAAGGAALPGRAAGVPARISAGQGAPCHCELPALLVARAHGPVGQHTAQSGDPARADHRPGARVAVLAAQSHPDGHGRALAQILGLPPVAGLRVRSSAVFYCRRRRRRRKRESERCISGALTPAWWVPVRTGRFERDKRRWKSWPRRRHRRWSR